VNSLKVWPVKRLFVTAAVVCSSAPWFYGCASLGEWAPGWGAGEAEVVYASDAEGNVSRGDAAMASKNYAEAARYYEFVKTKYPYLDAAKTSELKLGDADFERERFLEARDRYQNFVRLHPTHPKVDYAAYRVALTHYKDIPSDFFLLPPASEKDQVEVRSALGSMVDFTRTYPESAWVPDAKKVILEVKRRLAEHELYVAAFYAKRDRWPAVVTRLNTVAKNYEGIGYEERVYFGLYEAFNGLKDEARALEALRTFVAKYPDDAAVARAKSLLAKAPLPVAPPAVAPSAPADQAKPDAGS
jgi:outer membrane protein assembly factor BamD